MDWGLNSVVLLLAAANLLALGSITLSSEINFLKKQFVFFILGILVFVLFSLIDYRIFKEHSLILITFYIICLFLLLILLFFTEKIRGTLSWLKFGNLFFEPAELIKLALIFILSKYFSYRHIEMYRLRHIFISALYVILPSFLILLQPDIGSLIILGLVWFGIILISGIQKKHFILLMLAVFLIIYLGWHFVLLDYQKARILSFLSPLAEPAGRDYNIAQSKIAVGSAGFFGKGLGYGTQTQLKFLPEAHTDFVFAAFSEEWGIAGILFLFSLWFFLFWRLFKIVFNASNNFSRIFVSGVILMFFSQLFVHIGMNIGVLPITGVSMPFLSYGGSNLIVNFIALGIVQNIYRNQ